MALLDKVKKHWGEMAKTESLEKKKTLRWMVYPYIAKHYINRQISGDPEIDWLTYVKHHYVPQKLNIGLDVGCGDGWLERQAYDLGICAHFHAFDIAEDAIETAKEKAKEHGIEENVCYEVSNMNTASLGKRRYDIAFSSSAVHHFHDLEHVFSEVNECLRPSGIFALNEYIGPSQFQWTQKQMKIIDDILGILPEKYRQYINLPGQIKLQGDKPSMKWMNDYDPSEAIRSAEILSVLPKYFDVVKRIDFGGTLLHMLLNDIVGNFDEDDEDQLAFVKLLCYFEETLIKENVLSSDFAIIIARKRQEFISD